MRTYHLECEMLTERTLEETFKVFEDPHNLARITPSWLNFQVTTKDVHMKEGAEIEYTIKWLGLPMYWKTIIEEYKPPVLFIDRQAKGPYSLWRHQHTFVATAEGTRVGDHVEYALPLGVFGQAAHAVMVRRQLLQIFKFRQKELGKILGGKVEQTTPPTIRSRS